MGQIRKVGDTYFIEFYARGLLYSKIAGPDAHLAQQLLEETESKIAKGEELTVVRTIDLSAFFVQFLEFSRKEFGARTTRRFTHAVGHFSHFLNKHYPQVIELSKVTPAVFEAYKADLTSVQKPNLVNFSILLMREVMEYGIRLGFINDNPTIHVALLPILKKDHAKTKRYQLAQELLSKAVPLGKVCKLLQITDIARLMYYANLIPMSREEMYN